MANLKKHADDPAVMQQPAPEQEQTMQQPPQEPQQPPAERNPRAVQLGRAMAQKVLMEQKTDGNAPMTVNSASGRMVVGEEQVRKAEEILKKYKAGKAQLEASIIDAQEWYRMRNWRMMHKDRKVKGSNPSTMSNSGWLWSAIKGRLADMMDNYPEPIILPREEADKEEAQRLSEIIPVILKNSGFADVYNQCCLQKLVEGTGAYAVYWDNNAANGLGEISINKVSMLNLFWEPGVDDIQDSHNVFLVHLEDNDDLKAEYPDKADKFKGNGGLTVNKYRYDDSIDTTDKSLVVDWYYRKRDQSGRDVLHYCKFCCGVVLFATENDPEMAETGLYDTPEYPFVLDPLDRMEGTPAGFGLVAEGKDCQTDIDMLNQAIVSNAIQRSTPRYFVRKDGGVDDQEFADFTKMLVHCNANLGEDSIREIAVNGLDGNALSMLQQKISEMKFITGNTDVENGGTPTGVTAASAIAALKEDSGRASKDASRGTYRAFGKIVNMIIERIRQFYDMPRQFRIIGKRGEERFVSYTNAGIVPRYQGNDYGVDMGYRLPVFDLDVQAQRENVYTKTAQNELAIQLYQLGVFNPQQVDMSLMLLDMMDFRGKEDIQQKLQEIGGMQQMLVQYQQIALALAQQVDPQMAQQLAAIAQGAAADGMGAAPNMPPMGDKPMQMQEGDSLRGTKAKEPSETSRMAQTRARVQNAKAVT